MKSEERWLLSAFLLLVLGGAYYLNGAEQDVPLRVLFQRHTRGGAVQRLESDLATIAFDCYQISHAPHPTLDGVKQRYIEPLEGCVGFNLGNAPMDDHTTERFNAMRIDNLARARRV
jgi:hypothetical protein